MSLAPHILLISSRTTCNHNQRGANGNADNDALSDACGDDDDGDDAITDILAESHRNVDGDLFAGPNCDTVGWADADNNHHYFGSSVAETCCGAVRNAGTDPNNVDITNNGAEPNNAAVVKLEADSDQEPIGESCDGTDAGAFSETGSDPNQNFFCVGRVESNDVAHSGAHADQNDIIYATLPSDKYDTIADAATESISDAFPHCVNALQDSNTHTEKDDSFDDCSWVEGYRLSANKTRGNTEQVLTWC